MTTSQMLTFRTDDGKHDTKELKGPGGKLRLGVGNPSGERASVWVIEAPRNKGDVYVGNRDIMGYQKISLHQSGRWRWAWTEAKAPLVLPQGVDRVIDRWPRPPEVGAGWTFALRIWVPAEDVTTVCPLHGNRASLRAIHWVPKPPPGTALGFHVVMARPNQGEVHLKGYVPLAGFTLARDDGAPEACLVLLSRLTLTAEHRSWLDETRADWVGAAKSAGADLSSPTIRCAVYGVDEVGVRNVWDLSVAPVIGTSSEQ